MSELSLESLRNTCPVSSLQFDNTSQLSPLEGIIGQQRAVNSLEFGLGIYYKGFNIYAAGAVGTGKTTAITSFVENQAKGKSIPSDWCYVQNFYDPATPKALALPAGKAKEFQNDVLLFFEEVSRSIKKSLESEEYQKQIQDLTTMYQTQRETLLLNLSKQAQSKGFLIQTSASSLKLIPHKDGNPMTESELDNLTLQQRQKLNVDHSILEKTLKDVIDQIRGSERLLVEGIQDTDTEIANFTLDFLVNELKDKYSSLVEIVSYLDDVQKDIVNNISSFKSNLQDNPQANPGKPNTNPLQLSRRYAINVIVDHSETDGAPVIMEANPSQRSLLGHVDKETHMGSLSTDFTMIRAGLLHRANGGFLIIRIEEIINNKLAWEALKRCLKEELVMTDETQDIQGLVNSPTITPQPIPLDVKIVLIGDPNIYQALHAKDPDFVELFKVKAEFDSSMERTEQNISHYASFISTICKKENLLHMDKSGVAKLIEHSSRMVEDQTRLSTQFAEINDIIRESSYWATKDSCTYVEAKHVNEAIYNKSYRSGLIKDKIIEMIHEGTISIDTDSNESGQINGLSVMGLGDISFGRPNRITVSTGTGREGLIDIERESMLGGKLHTKGVMILAGYLTDKMAIDMPLPLVARIAFEQSYTEIDGDSASSAELYALLSSLSSLPINQGLAVTGSVNQKGQIQPIGGVNHKIEGFFEVCKAQGLNGNQGVLIPEANVKNLMLREEVLEAVGAGNFHIYSTNTIDEGIELLTGVKAGTIQPDGSFENGSVNQRVQEQLKKLGSNMKKFAAEQ